ncbi:MAG: hypothetical protein AB7O88_01650 [Reyranellaceae bacterium]
MCAAPVVWSTITTHHISKTLTTPFGKQVYITKGAGGSKKWLIGQHRVLKVLLPMLRGVSNFGTQLKALDVEFGRREGEGMPSNAVRTHKSFVSQMGIEAPMGQAEYDGILTRDGGRGWALPPDQRDAYVYAQPRRIDEAHPVASLFHGDASLESHHIVEKSLILDMGALAGDLTILAAPCVGSSKQPHSRKYTPEIASARGKLTSVAKIRDEYKRMYEDAAFGDLLTIAGVVLDAVEGA